MLQSLQTLVAQKILPLRRKNKLMPLAVGKICMAIFRQSPDDVNVFVMVLKPHTVLQVDKHSSFSKLQQLGSCAIV